MKTFAFVSLSHEKEITCKKKKKQIYINAKFDFYEQLYHI